MKYMKDPTENSAFKKRYFSLLDEFDHYVVNNLDVLDDFPYPITIAVTKKNDKDFSDKSIALARTGEKRPDFYPIVTAYKDGKEWVLKKLETQAV